jgi:hypothetical protein
VSEKPLGSASSSHLNVDLAPDGKRIAAIMPVDTPEGQKMQNRVTFLMNFSDGV